MENFKVLTNRVKNQKWFFMPKWRIINKKWNVRKLKKKKKKMSVFQNFSQYAIEWVTRIKEKSKPLWNGTLRARLLECPGHLPAGLSWIHYTDRLFKEAHYTSLLLSLKTQQISPSFWMPDILKDYNLLYRRRLLKGVPKQKTKYNF